MKQQTKTQQQKPPTSHTQPASDAGKLRHQEEAKEVAGRHKNDGQKDHKGAR